MNGLKVLVVKRAADIVTGDCVCLAFPAAWGAPPTTGWADCYISPATDVEVWLHVDAMMERVPEDAMIPVFTNVLLAERGTDSEAPVKNLMDAVELQNDTIRKLADSVRILNRRVEQLERDRPTRPIA